ncbi:hemolytic lectin [Mycena olivaceomarginata]|nr:hemolytic lectin [Mycena olivaceomarginata]
MTDFYVPPEGIFFRILGNASNRVLYSRSSGKPTFGSIPETSGTALFLIKGRQSGMVLYSRNSSPYVDHAGGNGMYDDNWFNLEAGKGQYAGMTRLAVPATNTVVVSRGEEITNFHGGTDIYANQYFKFQYEDMVVDRIDYDLKLGKVVGSAPRVLATETLVNKSASEQEMSFSISETQTHTSKFEYSTGLTVSVGATFKGGIPVFAEEELRVDVSVSQTWTYGKEDSFSVAYTANFPVRVEPHATVHAVATVHVGTLEVPYTLYLSSKSTGTKAQTKGIWRGVSSWDLRHTITPVPS